MQGATGALRESDPEGRPPTLRVEFAYLAPLGGDSFSVEVDLVASSRLALQGEQPAPFLHLEVDDPVTTTPLPRHQVYVWWLHLEPSGPLKLNGSPAVQGEPAPHLEAGWTALDVTGASVGVDHGQRILRALR